ncbi:MAG: Ig domain-containing protein [Dinoroseobacter sp.]|nr:Ig domain-containing protein [Dinoroseobacter sp.]MDJ0994756.1 Ig domain-containing protein [Dinoroseobacter sp.]
MTVTLIQASTLPPAATSGAAALNLEPVQDYAALMPFTDIVNAARIWVQQAGQFPGSGLENNQYPRDPVTWLPSRIPTGYTKITFFWAWSDQQSGSPVYGDYVLRHNLPGPYTFNLRHVNNVTSVSGSRIAFTVPDGAEDWYFEISGPEGNLPDGWFVEVIRTDQEAHYDNGSLPLAQRRYTTEYLDALRRVGPSCLRNINTLKINSNLSLREIADFAPDTARNFSQNAAPLNLICALSNELQADCWFNVHVRASDALIQHCAEYLRDNLDSNLNVYAEYGNENWNTQFSQTRVSSATGLQLLGTQGGGTVSIAQGSKTITATGVDLRTIMGNGGSAGSDQIAINGVAYTVNRSAVTATTAQITDGNAIDTASGVNWWYSQDGAHRRQEGYRIDATNVMEIFKAAFAATPDRLIRVAGGVLANNNTATTILDDSWWAGQPGYVPAADNFDAVAINLYFGSSFFSDGALKTDVTNLWNANNAQATRERYADVIFRRDGSFTTSRDFPRIESDLAAHRAITEPLGLRLISYEGGTHIIHGGTIQKADTAIMDSFRDFLTSPEASEVFEYWRDLHIRYLDGPVMQYRFSSNWNRFGFFGMFDRFNMDDDSRTLVVQGEKTKEPWWLAEHPPHWAQIPAQSWTSGQFPGFDLSEWSSVNTMAWEGTPPPGTSLDPMTGIITGTPQSGAGSYTFTALNASGSVDITVPVNVS